MGVRNRALEDRVQWLWEQAVQDALPDHDVVILADTHLDLPYLDEEVAWLRGLGVLDMAIQYFAALPLVELIRRDQGRPNFVGAAVLREHVQKLQSEKRYWAALEQRLANGIAERREKRCDTNSVL